MTKDSEEQLKLAVQEAEREKRPRAKRLRLRKPPRTDRVARKPEPESAGKALMRSPERARCGFCGQRLTVLEDVAECPSCGSIVSRGQEDE